MKKSAYVLFAVMFLVLGANMIFSQDAPSLTGKGKVEMFPPTEAVLYEQMANAGTNSLTSQNFEASFDAYDNQGADDFTVPAGLVWTIQSVEVLGVYYNGAGPANSVNVWFYNNNAGFPGTTAAEVLNIVPSGGLATGSFIITFASPIPLSEGSYWLSVQCNMDYSVGGQWGWTEQTQNGLESTWRNPGGGFGTPCTAWGYRVTNCVIGASPYFDFSFRLNGTSAPIPVELTSFTASANNGIVELNWSTATETNNKGFEIERSVNGQFVNIGYVAGHGTVTEKQNYSFVDRNLSAGTYTYRLKQIDFNGEFEYSNEVEVEVSAPAEFSLGQNYPNPFNPSTKISYSLAVDSKVSLKIFNVLGQQVAQLLNSSVPAGVHEVNFYASGFNSGVYFYQLEANGIDGQTFSSTQKMILSK
ncbi:MAG: T9SS type A sorting domain-containing protein [Ignavibacteriaceae bacterium]|nr:T9SS type A sorting domain-containing protein [Ignavibacteriaceae bacterium]